MSDQSANTPEQVPQTKQPRELSPRTSGKERLLLTIVYFLLAGCAALLIWKLSSESSLQSQMDQQRSELQKTLSEQTVALLRLSAIPLGWTVRSELMKGNLEAISDYFNRFVKEEKITEILFIRNDGKIMVATDKKKEGLEFNSMFREGFSATDMIVVDRTENNRIRVIIPIMGFNNKLGNVLMIYDGSEEAMGFSPPAAE